jgi:uncharacterized protein YdaU (DUF1376 family)
MHYYQKNIADYRKDTMGLDHRQHGTYTLLIDLYYMDESPLSLDLEKIYFQINARSEEEKKSVQLVLKNFFDKTDSGYTHRRCEAELHFYRSKLEASSKGGKKSAALKKLKQSSEHQVDLESTSSGLEFTTKQPITNIQEPKNKVIHTTDRFEDFWKAWPKSERKIAKEACKTKWAAHNLDPIADKIIAHVEHMKKTDQWQSGFEPMVLTYLNQKRYLDDNNETVKAGLPPNMVRRAL